MPTWLNLTMNSLHIFVFENKLIQRLFVNKCVGITAKIFNFDYMKGEKELVGSVLQMYIMPA